MKTPQNTTVVSELEKPGIRFRWDPTLHTTVESLFERRTLSRAQVQKWGFIVIDGYTPPDDEHGQHTIPSFKLIEGIMQNAEGTQLLHRDGSGDQDLVLLRYGGKGNMRPADTAIAVHGQAMFTAYTEFFLRHADAFEATARIPRIVGELRERLATMSCVDVAGVEAASSFNHLPWGSFLFQGFGTSVLGNPLLNDFYRDAVRAKLVYSHRWQHDQAVLIDNQAMLHGRVMRDDLASAEADQTPVSRRLFQWRGDVPCPIAAHKTHQNIVQ